MMSLEKTRDDFDRIARLAAEAPERRGPYDAFLLGQLPAPPARLLEVGCGTGALCRAAAAAGHTVTGIDLSPEMVRVARQRTADSCPVTFRCGDFFSLTLPEEGFDCVLSAATLHHLPLDAAVTRMADLTRPGGVLVIHDLRSDEGIWDRARSLGGVAARAWTRLRAGWIRERAELRAAWREHGHTERYPTLKEVDAWRRKHLPGARGYRHLQWRYTVVWRKPGPP
jgi:SAM-dependent methyltransferase